MPQADRGGKLGKTCVGLEGCFLTRRRARQWKTDQRREEQEQHKQAVCRCVGSGCLTVLGGSGASSIPVLRGVVRSAWFATRSTPQRSDRQSEQISLKHAGWVLFPL